MGALMAMTMRVVVIPTPTHRIRYQILDAVLTGGTCLSGVVRWVRCPMSMMSTSIIFLVEGFRLSPQTQSMMLGDQVKI